MEGRYSGTCTCTGSIVSELEGALLKSPDLFPYFMLVAFEASGLIRFILLLLSYPIIKFFDLIQMSEIGHRLMVFIAVAGVKISEIEVVARAVLPKFYIDDVDMNAWDVYVKYEKKVVVSKFPRVMVERFVKDHLRADEVIGCELQVNRVGIATGFVKKAVEDQVREILNDYGPHAGLGKPLPELCLCKEHYPPSQDYQNRITGNHQHHHLRPHPVIFHDGRLARLPTPFTSLIIILYLPIGIIIAITRITVGIILPMCFIPYVVNIFGGSIVVRGRPPPPTKPNSGGVLFVCTHRTLMDPVVLSMVLGREIPAVTYSISRLSEILSPIRTVQLTRDRQIDSEKIKSELRKNDLVVCPEGTTCREPFLLRFSALFAELSDRIVPVAMNYRLGFFHATTARGWKAMDPIFFFMNPRPVYEVTFLNQLPVEDTCSSGKSPHDVANYVQRILGAALGFECTNFTRKDKYRVLAGHDGNVVMKNAESWMGRVREMVGFMLH